MPGSMVPITAEGTVGSARVQGDSARALTEQVTPHLIEVGARQPLWKRPIDVFLALLLLIVAAPLFLTCFVLVRLTSRGPALHWSRRIGKNNVIFLMPKFRTMFVHAPQLATHLFSDVAIYITPVGRFLRKTSLDELPQLWSVLKGELSLVGPRPALFNQDDLVALRTAFGAHHLMPGITGWAQVNGRDEIPIPIKVGFDVEYMRQMSIWFDLKILCLTLLKVCRAEGVHH